jgi:hypothetical protein
MAPPEILGLGRLVLRHVFNSFFHLHSLFAFKTKGICNGG